MRPRTPYIPHTLTPLVTLALAVGLVASLAGAAFSAEDKYTQTSKCNAANTQWEVTTTCTKTVGGGLKAFQSGVQYAPAAAGVPSVTITDLSGNPILVGGTVLTMEPSAVDSAEAHNTYGTLSPDHVWAGFRSNVELDEPVAAGTVVYKVTYTWSTSVDPTGAVWFSSTFDQTPGNTVVDAFTTLPDPTDVPASSAWMLLVAAALLLGGTALVLRRRANA